MLDQIPLIKESDGYTYSPGPPVSRWMHGSISFCNNTHQWLTNVSFQMFFVSLTQPKVLVFPSDSHPNRNATTYIALSKCSWESLKMVLSAGKWFSPPSSYPSSRLPVQTIHGNWRKRRLATWLGTITCLAPVGQTGILWIYPFCLVLRVGTCSVFCMVFSNSEQSDTDWQPQD